VVNPYRCFVAVPLDFGDPRGLVDLERFSSDGLVMCKWIPMNSR